jgi:hypothetical protein
MYFKVKQYFVEIRPTYKIILLLQSTQQTVNNYVTVNGDGNEVNLNQRQNSGQLGSLGGPCGSGGGGQPEGCCGLGGGPEP